MSLFLYKPHVSGSAGVTTPDLLIDHVSLNKRWLGVHTVSSALELDQQALSDSYAAVALCSAGGGTLLSPALVSVEGAVVSVARKALRLADVEDVLSSLTLNGKAVSPLFERTDEFGFAGFDNGNLPRGHMLLLQGDAIAASNKGRLLVELADTSSGKTLSHTMTIANSHNGIEVANHSPSLYAIGPTTKKVDHYNIVKPE